MASSSRTVVSRSTRSFRCSALAVSARSAGVRVRTSATSSSVSLPTRSLHAPDDRCLVHGVRCPPPLPPPPGGLFVRNAPTTTSAIVALRGCRRVARGEQVGCRLSKRRLGGGRAPAWRFAAPGPQALGFVAPVEHPLERQLLALGVAHDTLAVAPELGVVRGQQDQPGQDAVTELVDDLGRAVVRLHLPVGGDGAQVDDAHVPDWLDRLTFFDDFFLGVRGHGTSWHRRSGPA